MENLKELLECKKLYHNLTRDQLRELAKAEEITTSYGSASYVTKVRNRSAKASYIVDNVELGIQQQPIKEEKALEISRQVFEYLRDKEVICVDRTMGNNKESMLNCRLYITKDYSRIAYKWSSTLFEPQSNFSPDITSVYVPEWPERIIFADVKRRVTFILGTDYFGESKKSFLRMAMYITKEKGGLGLHAGSKILRVKNSQGNLQDIGFIMFGLSGTGKTTLTLHNHGLEGEETATVRQDDVVLMNSKGYCYGTENGFYIKTEGLSPSQTVLYNAAISKNAIFDNVWINTDGTIDFDNVELTSNGRGVVLREDIQNTDDMVDLPKANKIIFITRRNDIVPPVAKLTPQQAAEFFMLGESIETSAGDPTKAGQSKREVGTNPFIVGPEYIEGLRFLEIISSNSDMECYLLNTGSVGAKEGSAGEKVTIKVSTEIMKQIAKGGIDWKLDTDWGYLVADRVEGIDIKKYDPTKHYTKEEYRDLVNKLRKERKEWLNQFNFAYREAAITTA